MSAWDSAYGCMGMSVPIQLNWGLSQETAPHSKPVEGGSNLEIAPGIDLRKVLLDCIPIHAYTHTLCSGMRTRWRNCLCSSFNGRAKPLIMLEWTGGEEREGEREEGKTLVITAAMDQ